MISSTAIFASSDIEATLAYRGEQLELAELLPSTEDILAEGGHRPLAGFLIRRQADRAKSTMKEDLCLLQLTFRQ